MIVFIFRHTSILSEDNLLRFSASQKNQSEASLQSRKDLRLAVQVHIMVIATRPLRLHNNSGIFVSLHYNQKSMFRMQDSEADRMFGRPQKRKASVKGDADLDEIFGDESDDDSEEDFEDSESGSELEPDETARVEKLVSEAVKGPEKKKRKVAQTLRDEAVPESEFNLGNGEQSQNILVFDFWRVWEREKNFKIQKLEQQMVLLYLHTIMSFNEISAAFCLLTSYQRTNCVLCLLSITSWNHVANKFGVKCLKYRHTLGNAHLPGLIYICVSHD